MNGAARRLSSPTEAVAKACCADLYQSDLAKLILGDTLHPGGLGLTNKLGRLTGIQPGERVIDLASARGASAMAVARVFHCEVVGVEFGEAALKQANAAAADQAQTAATRYVRGDAESPPFRDESFDRALCECSMSLFIDKAKAVAETARMLRPGGTFGLSDVTIEPGALPPELEGDLGLILCMTDALTAGGYVRLLEEGGFQVTGQVDASLEIVKILDEVEPKLAAYLAFQRLSGQAASDSLGQAPQLIAAVRELVATGRLGYWLFVGQKPG